jgi:hypothetical protein
MRRGGVIEALGRIKRGDCTFPNFKNFGAGSDLGQLSPGAINSRRQVPQQNL